MTPRNYPVDIVKRTKELIESQYQNIERQDSLEFTFLINCLLGLVVAVAEGDVKEFKKPIDDDFLSYIPREIGFFKKGFVRVKNILENPRIETPQLYGWNDLKGQSKEWFVGKLRNAIAHQHIAPIPEQEDVMWAGVKMWNEPIDGIVDFEIHLTKEELKNLAIKIAEDYIRVRDFSPKFKDVLDYK